MRVIIAGSRHCNDYSLLLETIKESGFSITEVVSGHARGVDTMGEHYAETHGIPLKVFPAQWDVYGLAAGPKRNRQMADYAQALIAVMYPGSRGTMNMVETAKKLGLRVYVKMASIPEQ